MVFVLGRFDQLLVGLASPGHFDRRFLVLGRVDRFSFGLARSWRAFGLGRFDGRLAVRFRRFSVAAMVLLLTIR